jgi:hypothetical protein
VITAMIALNLNCFILVVLFEKVTALHALDPMQSGPPFKFTQLAVLMLFFVPTIAAAIRFRIAPARRLIAFAASNKIQEIVISPPFRAYL